VETIERGLPSSGLLGDLSGSVKQSPDCFHVVRQFQQICKGIQGCTPSRQAKTDKSKLKNRIILGNL
jgi:hypothetical protein